MIAESYDKYHWEKFENNNQRLSKFTSFNGYLVKWIRKLYMFCFVFYRKMFVEEEQKRIKQLQDLGQVRILNQGFF